jgi:hypothetical protein
MSQKARPIADVPGKVSGWTPTPVTPEVNEVVPDDSTYVSSITPARKILPHQPDAQARESSLSRKFPRLRVGLV